MPDGLLIQNKFYKLTQKQFKVRGTGRQARSSIRLKMHQLNKEGNMIPDRLSLVRGFGVNFIHSMDAYIARYVTSTFQKHGSTITTIHDCFIVNPENTTLLYATYNSALCEAVNHGRKELLRLLDEAKRNAKSDTALSKKAANAIANFRKTAQTTPTLENASYGPLLFF
jgi:hypothetical protein